MDDRITDKQPGPEPWGGYSPRKQPPPFRLRREPHRVRLLSLLSDLSMACGVLSLFLLLPSLIGLLLAAATISAAGEDLQAMAEGRMDPRGRKKTLEARRLAYRGVAFSVLSWVVAPLLYAAIAYFWPRYDF